VWIYAKNIGFLSVVEHEGDTDDLLVRARSRAHLEQVHTHISFRGDIVEDEAADYRFRVRVRRSDFIELMVELIVDIDYTSHVKEEVSGYDNSLYAAMMRSWTAMLDYQEGRDIWDDEDVDDSDLSEDSQDADDQDGIPVPGRQLGLTSEEAEMMFSAMDEAAANIARDDDADEIQAQLDRINERQRGLPPSERLFMDRTNWDLLR
jgi:hypothetical protein